MERTKEERQAWWRGLTFDEKDTHIRRWQGQRERRRRPKVKRFDPKYPWATEGVNRQNKEQWMDLIIRKNPWLLE